LTLDLDLMCSFGRHLAEVVRVALQPQGHVAGGSPWQWLRTLIGWALLASFSSWGVAELASRVVQPLAQRLTPLVRQALGAAIALLAVALVLVPHWLSEAWRTPGLYERVYAALLFDPRIGSAAAQDGEHVDPALRALSRRLRRAYRVAFPALGAGERGSVEPVALPQQRPPNVILIVAESLRHDVFGEELMPRLTHWAQAGLTASQHDSGTNYSQSALFALLYGRSPALYHQTLNAKVPPQLCVTLRASGYECAYFSGHPKIWMRREEFVNPQTMDHFVHDDSGTWPDWDRRALDGMVKLAAESEKPIFAIVLLMSSHFEYRYPPEYERDLPVANSAWNVTYVSSLGAAAQEPHRNRYRNCMRFVDDVVADAIGRLDPQRNLVLFTGDHGESIFDDGHYTHGYSFADIETRTPLAIVGPGVAPGTLDRPTYHVDVLPSVLHLLSGAHVSIPHIQGSDWFADAPPTSALVAHSPPDGSLIQTQLRTNGLRLRLDLDMLSPRVTLLGFEDSLGHLISHPQLGSEAENELVGAMESQLLALRR
jgi:Sulfatase